MLQAIIKKGRVLTEEVPAPMVADGSVLIQVVNSCISTGTEISGLVASGKSPLRKVLEQPEKVRRAVELARDQGIRVALDKAMGNSDVGHPTGYSVSGVVKEIGNGVILFRVGDRVAASGAGYANHAEVVCVPEKLVTRMPVGMDFKSASTVAVGAIAMHGVRRADLKLGEYCVVTGTGILGLLAIQMLRISGVRIAAIDLDDKRLAVAESLGVEITLNPSRDSVVKAVEGWTGGFGADAVMFTAATASSAPLSQAFKMCKRKGRVVLVGTSGMAIERDDIYTKEIDFQISTSYGPGRYDKAYEEKGIDYPYGYVRWTENRNMTEYLRLVHSGTIKLDSLLNAVFPSDKIAEAFESLQNAASRPIIALIDYGRSGLGESQATDPVRTVGLHPPRSVSKGIVRVALIGAGNFATSVHLPNIRKMTDKYSLLAVMDQNGLKAESVAVQFGAEYATTEFDRIISDPKVDLVLIATRHNSHAQLALQGLVAGKHVFVEKPLATTPQDLAAITRFYSENRPTQPVLMVGFNRRFSNCALEIRKQTDRRISPLFIHYRINAGYAPADHWVHEDGGRIIGEGCHIIDLMSYFTNSNIESLHCESLDPGNGKFGAADNKAVMLKYRDGSIAVITYFSVGNNAFPKECMEIHFDEKTIVMEDYRSLVGYGLRMPTTRTNRSEKGHYEELIRLHDTLCGKNGQWPIEFGSLVETTEAAFALAR